MDLFDEVGSGKVVELVETFEGVEEGMVWLVGRYEYYADWRGRILVVLVRNLQPADVLTFGLRRKPISTSTSSIGITRGLGRPGWEESRT